MSRAAEIHVMSSAAMKAAYLELAPAFERATGNKVVTKWIPGVDLLQRVKDGETCDLVIMQASSIDELIRLGRLAHGSRIDLAKSGVGMAVRAGARRPDIGSGEAVKRALLAAKSLAYSTGPSGVYILRLFEHLGIAAELKPKSRQVKGEPVGAVVARGEAELGFQQVSELLPVPGIDVIGPLPPEIQHVTVFAAGVHIGAKEPAAATALARFIAAPAASAVIRKTGMEPV